MSGLRSDRTLLAAAGALALLLVVVTVILGRGANAAEIPSTYATGSGGASAMYRLLGDAHYAVTRWERPVHDLPLDTAATLILAEPEANPTKDEQLAIARFVERGGRVIATGFSGAFFLPDHDVFPDPIAGLVWKRVPALSPSFVTRAAPEMTLAPLAWWSPDAAVVPLYGDAGNARVVKYTVGQGEVMWWASPTPLTNAGAREAGNLEFFLACLGDARRPVLWDEYFHGHRVGGSASLVAVPLKWTGVQLAVLVAAVLLTYSRRSGPIVPAAEESRLSPLEFVQTLGSLYRRAAATSTPVDIAYRRFKYRLTQRLGLASFASVDDLQRAAGDRWQLAVAPFGDLLRACEAAREDAHLPPAAALQLTRSLADYSQKLKLVPPAARESA